MHAIRTAAAILALAAGPALADDIETIAAKDDVPGTMDALVEAVESAGATVFARVNHAEGAQTAGLYMRPSEVLIFGNPEVGSPIMQEDRLAGLYLPLKVLVYEDSEGKVWLAYQAPEEMFDDLKVDDDSEAFEMMERALEALTAKAAEGS